MDRYPVTKWKGTNADNKERDQLPLQTEAGNWSRFETFANNLAEGIKNPMPEWNMELLRMAELDFMVEDSAGVKGEAHSIPC